MAQFIINNKVERVYGELLFVINDKTAMIQTLTDMDCFNEWMNKKGKKIEVYAIEKESSEIKKSVFLGVMTLSAIILKSEVDEAVKMTLIFKKPNP